MPEVELRHVDFTIGGKDILRDVHLALERGETVAIIGPSGAGKTTILRLILGFIRPDAGVVFQGAALFTALTVYENVAFGLEETGMSQAQVRARVAGALRSVGLEGFAERMPNELSGGQAQRVAVARAIAGEPRIMLYDEPTQGLDPVSASEVIEQILRLARTGVTSIVVTHQLEYAQRYAQRVVVLRDGGIRFDGRITDLPRLDEPFVQAYRPILHWEASP